MSNFEDNPSVSHKPIDVVKTQLHIIQSELNQLKKDIHNIHIIQGQVITILRKIEERNLDKERIDREEKKKIQSGWGIF